ncbi:MAG: peptide chain release factor N(5)-glutamine methyltransferase [Candidatus Thiodiazotropha sp.]
MHYPAGFETYLKQISADFIPMADKPEESPESVLRALWLLATGQQYSAESAMAIDIRSLDNQETSDLKQYLDRWLAGEPLGHITNRQCFCEHEFIVAGQALIPRKETELLAYKTIDIIRQLPDTTPTIIDICTGCGNLPIIFKHHYPASNIYAADLSADAIELAQKNCDFHNFTGQIHFATGDLLTPFDSLDLKGNVDIVTCNPPYISSKKVSAMAQAISEHEPAMAFDGGPFGITILQRTINDSAEYLKPGGWLLFEVGVGQGKPLQKMVDRSGFYSRIETGLDASEQVRVIAAQRSTE